MTNQWNNQAQFSCASVHIRCSPSPWLTVDIFKIDLNPIPAMAVPSAEGRATSPKVMLRQSYRSAITAQGRTQAAQCGQILLFLSTTVSCCDRVWYASGCWVLGQWWLDSAASEHSQSATCLQRYLLCVWVLLFDPPYDRTQFHAVVPAMGC